MSKKNRPKKAPTATVASTQTEETSLPAWIVNVFWGVRFFMKRPALLPVFLFAALFIFLMSQFPTRNETIGFFDKVVFILGGISFSKQAFDLFASVVAIGLIFAFVFRKRKFLQTTTFVVLSLIASTFFFIAAEHWRVAALVPRDSRQILFYVVKNCSSDENVTFHFFTMIHRSANDYSTQPNLIFNDKRNVVRPIVHGMAPEDSDRILNAIDCLKRAGFVTEDPDAETFTVEEGEHYHNDLRIRTFRVTRRGKFFCSCYLEAQTFPAFAKFLLVEPIEPLEGSNRFLSGLQKIPIDVRLDER